LLCVCGQGIDVLPEHAGWKGHCPRCQRFFEIIISQDVVSLAYIQDRSGAADTAAETSVELPEPPKKPGAITEANLKAVPEPPDEAQFRCDCGILLSIPRAHFDKRVKCPHCGARRLITLGFDAESGNYTLHTFSLFDRPSGATKLAVRIS
ncbi:MAG TPA: hypothetical protein VEJ18_20850, partial [Planctomycetota bacterium]|nr:hypothetical protein [Planctomycetota bacterium]